MVTMGTASIKVHDIIIIIITIIIIIIIIIIIKVHEMQCTSISESILSLKRLSFGQLK